MNRKDSQITSNSQDPQAEFLQVHEEHADAVFRRCFFKTSDREVAHDLTQEAFMKTWDYIADGNEIRHMKGFIFAVANNLIKDYYKKSKAIRMGEMEEYDPSSIPDVAGENTIEAQAEVEQVLIALQELEERDRDVLVMNLVEGLGPKDIARVLNERENTISVRIHRAKKRLRTHLSE